MPVGSRSAPSSLERRLLFAVELGLLALGIGLRFLYLDADIPLLQNADDLGDEGYWLVPARDLLRFGAFDAGTAFHQAEAGAPLSVLTWAALGWASGGLDLRLARSVSAFYSSLSLVLGLVYFDRMKRLPLAAVAFLGLYGLLPVTLFYSRIAHLDQHLLFHLFLAFVVLERARRPAALLAAGLVASLAIAVKVVALLILPAFGLYLVARDRRRAPASLLLFAAGSAPVLAVLGVRLWLNADRFAPTATALGSYVSTGFFVDAFSLEYFWLHPLVAPSLPWIALALATPLVLHRGDPARLWILSWLAVALLALSVFKYGSWPRHMLLFFPLLLLASVCVGEIHARARSAWSRAAVAMTCVGLLAGTALAATWNAGRNVFLEPRFTYRDAALRVAAVTDASDRVVGVHDFALALAAEYRPRMTLHARQWRGVDELDRVRPTAVLVANVFNGQRYTGRGRGWERVFPRADDFAHSDLLDFFTYLDGRFEIELRRVFATRAEYERFRRFRQGRRSRYDGLLYNRYAGDLETGCLLKGILVAESRGDPEVSHRKISATGCAGMMGFCDETAREPLFADVFERLVSNVDPRRPAPEIFQRDDRFNPHKSLRAAERYVGELRARFGGYTDVTKLVFAAYNGGPGFTAFLVERSGKADPRWDEDLLPLLSVVGATHPGYAQWPPTAREHKLGFEIPHYVDDAWRTWDACLHRKAFEVAGSQASVPIPVRSPDSRR